MTKRHFEVIAGILSDNLDASDHDAEQQAIGGVARDLADYFQSENPRFDRARFLTACGF